MSEHLQVATRSFSVVLYWACERTVEPRFADHPLRGAWPLIAWRVLSGTAEIRSAAGTARALPGQWLFPASADGRQLFAEATRLLSIRFQIQRTDGLPWLRQKRHLVVDGSACAGLDAAARELIEDRSGSAARQGERVGSEWVERSFEQHTALLRWAGIYARTVRTHDLVGLGEGRLDDRVAAALRMLHGAASEQKLHEPELARSCGLSVNQLCRLFQRDTGMTPKQCHEAIRMERARSLLQASVQPIKQIAFSLGFSSPQHFSNWFRAQSDLTPTEFRNAERGI